MSGPSPLVIRPANEAGCEDLQQVFGTRGQAARCQCQRYRLRPRETFATQPVEERIARLQDQTGCGDPCASETSGLVAYLDAEPVGWCAVAPRPHLPGLRHSQVPWQGRDEDREDATVWAITCVFARAHFRRQGISRALILEAAQFARSRGAAAVEAYPMTRAAISEELHVGTLTSFLEAGFTELGRPTARRAVVRLDFPSLSSRHA
ncbi:GNAT family N-acetyltransferase [Ornithinimicrobium cryptoxanthini]|uniref:GNAT family N-acetyltransferase n=1 Tax=Ornithinimicrobium cryptoxanthini TaxID=2934161 RepID=A0ABY4YK68_9MICO|nr:GNAT family N-acetyltransferase [Ornithinimicrobium cryptoxanthini]USQ77084.1 GNAT family N-acetyltransferase [Ornithinimicrobium cryptoxanthini]